MLHSIFVFTAWMGAAILLVSVIGGYFWVDKAVLSGIDGYVAFYVSACAAALGLSMLIVGLVGAFFT